MKKNLRKAYGIDASQFKGTAKEVIIPKTIQEVQQTVLQHSSIVCRGAGTGLSGGAVPINSSDIVLDLTKLNAIGGLDLQRKTVEVGAGVVLDDLQSFLTNYGLEFPVIPLSHTVATIGGMIATNATSGRTSKYDQTTHWIRWIEIVDDQGNVHRKGATEISDYAGLEGTTGVIVRACLKLESKKHRTGSLVGVASLEEAVALARTQKRNSAVTLIDFFDKITSSWLGFGKGYFLIIEYTDGSGVLNQEEYTKLMALVETIYSFAFTLGHTRIEDPKILMDRLERLVTYLERKEIPFFGHLSTGVLHPFLNAEQEILIPEMMKFVKRLGGQISGSQGIGIQKKEFVEMNDKKIFENIKKRTDPLHKFNAGKIL